MINAVEWVSNGDGSVTVHLVLSIEAPDGRIVSKRVSYVEGADNGQDLALMMEKLRDEAQQAG